MGKSGAISAGWRYDSLPEHAWPRLRALLDGVSPGKPALDLSLGEPKHPMPEFVGDILATHMAEFGRYPPNEGTPEFLSAAANWLTRRYSLPTGMIEPARHILPMNGTREGLFSAPQALIPPKAPDTRPAILIPNPFYQCYAAAAVAAGAEPVYLDTTADTGYLPDFWNLSEELLTRTMAVYLCSPANPQGTVADRTFWTRLLALAEQYDFAIIADECYAEIYDKAPPEGLLEAAKGAAPEMRRILSFHSLSKRSCVPGLRSGFVVGDPDLVTRLRKLKSYGGAPLPLPVLAASTALWNDEAHVAPNRAAYGEKIDLAASVLKGRFGFYRPPGGFFLWLDVSESGLSGEDAAAELWRAAGVKVLPGAYLARDTGSGNPGQDYIRLALVHDKAVTGEALERVAETL